MDTKEVQSQNMRFIGLIDSYTDIELVTNYMQCVRRSNSGGDRDNIYVRG